MRNAGRVVIRGRVYDSLHPRLQLFMWKICRLRLADPTQGGILRVLFSTQAPKSIMYAVVEIAGQQFVVAPNQTLTVPKLDSNVGDTVEFSNVVLTSKNGAVTVGTPYVKATVKATVNDHGKGEKVLVFHKKRRKGYQKLNGYRSHFTSITINAINV